MSDAVRRKRLSALVVFGACTSRNCVAFAPSSAYASKKSANAWNIRLHHRRQMLGDKHMTLELVGTKRPRSTKGKVAIEEDDSETQHPDDGQQPTPRKPKIKFQALPDFMQKDPLMVTKQRWLEETTIIEEETPLSDRQKNEMMIMSAVSLALAVGVVYALASSAPEMIKDTQTESENVVRDLMREGNAERLEIATRNIVGTVLPNSAEDVIAVSIGEGIAGAIGAFATWLLGLILNFKSDDDFVVTPANGGGRHGSGGSGPMGGQSMNALVSEAVADGDYFLTRAAAQPLLEAVGIPLFFASLASVLIATVPYEAVKITSQKRRQDMKEKVLLEMLLEEEENRKKNQNVVDRVSNNVFEFISKLNVRANFDDDVADDNIDDEVPGISVLQKEEEQKNVPALDYVELFADLTKWLEYDVLISNYRGVLTLPNGMLLSTGWESAIFGLLAALSSQLYTDVLYLYSDFGNPIAREKTLNRSLEGWTSVYATKCLSAATLFGVYEAVRAPTSRALSQLVSGGVGGCVGSQDFDLCIETYLIDNPPSATLGANFRATVVSGMNSLDNLSWLVPLNDQESLNSFLRGAAVSFYSELIRFFNM